MLTFLRKLERQIRIDGVLGVIAKIPLWLRGKREARLDRKLGIDTIGRVDVAESARLEPGHAHESNAVFYAPLQFRKFRHMIRAARPFDARQYTFIDFGAGKGRALVLAATLDFPRVVGIELFEALHGEAGKNVAAFASRDPRAGAIELLCMDAAGYSLPSGNLFCYFYNPFDDVVMRAVLANIRSAHESAPRHIIIAYSNPVHAHVLDNAGFLQQHHASDGLRIYTNGGSVSAD